MSIALPIGSQSIEPPPSSTARPIYPPTTPHAESSPPTFSITQLTDRIDICVQRYLSPEFLDSLGSPLAFSPLPFPPLIKGEFDSCELMKSDQAQADSLPAPDLQAIAEAYSETCSLIWQQSLAQGLANVDKADINKQEAYPKGDFSEPLTQSLQTLCFLWATGKCQHPGAAFFHDAITLGALQAKWRYPAIQDSLRHTTETLRSNSSYAQWLKIYPTCWSYAIGRTMQQLLQWNYRLTPTTLREFLILD